MKKILYIVLTDTSYTNNGEDYTSKNFPECFTTFKRAKKRVDTLVKYAEKIVSENNFGECGYEIVTKSIGYPYVRRIIYRSTLNME